MAVKCPPIEVLRDLASPRSSGVTHLTREERLLQAYHFTPDRQQQYRYELLVGHPSPVTGAGESTAMQGSCSPADSGANLCVQSA